MMGLLLMVYVISKEEDRDLGCDDCAWRYQVQYSHSL